MNPGEPFSKDGNSCGVQSLISLVQVKAEILFKSSEKEGTGAEQTKNRYIYKIHASKYPSKTINKLILLLPHPTHTIKVRVFEL